MAAPVVTFLGTKAVDGESITTQVGSLALNPDIFLHGTNSVSDKVSAATVTAYLLGAAVTGDPFAFQAGGGNELDHIFMITQVGGTVDTLANGGIGIIVANDDTTDSVGQWYVAPQPGYLGGWVYCVIDPALDFDAFTAGTAGWTQTGNPDQLTSVDGLGVRWKVTNTVMGASDNCWLESISVGTGFRVTNGDAGSAEAKFSDFTAKEETDRYGAIQSASGVVFPLCKLRVGFASGAGDTEFTDTGFTVVWQSARVRSDFYAFHVEKGSGTTTVILTNGSLSAAGTTEVYLDFAGGTAVTLTNVNATRARLIDLDSAVTWNGGTIKDSGKMDLGGSPVLTGLTFIDATDGFTMEMNSVAEFDNVDNILFDGSGVGGAGNGALYINITGAGPFTIDLNDINFQNRVSGSHDIVIAANDNADYTLNVIGGTTPTVNNLGSGDVTIVTNPVTLSVHAQDIETSAAISGARVLVLPTSGASGYPFDESVTIVSTGTTATVTHTAHGLTTGDSVLIEGANEAGYNGVFQVTVTDLNTYTYTMTTDPASPATGTITATWAIINGTTNGSGDISATYSYSADQPITGRVRKSSASPFYSTAPIAGTVDSATGLALTVQMVQDE